jgi:Tol biopolymer transport system component
VSRPERLTLDDRKNLPYEWTPDGKAVIYISNREGRFHIYRQAVGEGAPELLDSGSEEPNILRLSPDGTEILFISEVTRNQSAQGGGRNSARNENQKQAENAAGHEENFNQFRLLRIPLSGGKGQLVLEQSGINNFQCARAPARKCVFSNFTSAALEFYEFDPKTGAHSLMFRISDPVWQLYNWTLSPNGELLALAKKLRAQEEAEIQVLSLQGGSTRRIGLKDWRSVNTIDWAADSKSIWASASPRPGEEVLMNVDLQGKVKPAVRGTSPYVGWAIPSQDGKRLAIWEASGASNLWMLENF